MTPDERKRLLESINVAADKIVAVGEAFDHMRSQCEKPNTTDAFLQLMHTAGAMTLANLDHLETLLEHVCPAGPTETNP